MIKVSIFLTRRAGLSHQEFIRYWSEQHTPLLADLPGGELPVHRYVQLHPVDGHIPGVETASYDAVAEVWVDSVEDAARWFTSKTYTTTVAADEENFLDRSKTRYFYAEENVIFG